MGIALVDSDPTGTYAYGRVHAGNNWPMERRLIHQELIQYVGV